MRGTVYTSTVLIKTQSQQFYTNDEENKLNIFLHRHGNLPSDLIS